MEIAVSAAMRPSAPRMPRPTRCAAAVAVVLAGLSGTAAQAQDAPPFTNTDAPAVQKVIVSGTRQSVMSAIERKKSASTVTDSIVAEDIGQFPDKNVGEALSRITGVQITRDFGEGSQVSIRGVEPNLNRVEINGLSVLSTNNTAGRGAELRELPAELIKSIDVYKGVTADITEGGIGGTVVIKTNKPFDFKKFTFASTVSGENSTLRGGIQPRASALVADRFLGGDLGLMANVVYDKVLTQGDFVRNTGWRFLRDWDFSPEKTVTSTNPTAAAVTTPAGCANLTGANKTACDRQWYDYTPSVPRYGIWTRDHKRMSGEFTAQYKINNELNVWGTFQRNKQDQMLNDRNFGTDFGDVNRLANVGTAPVYNANGSVATAGTCTPVSTTATPAGMVVTNHHVTEYVVGNCQAVSGQGGYNAFSTAARDFNLRVDSYYRSGGFFWRKGDWDAEGLIAKTNSGYANDTNNVVLTQNAPGLKVSLDSMGLPHFTFPAAFDPNNAASYTRAELQYRPTESTSREDQIKLDVKYRTSIPFITRLYMGGQARNASMRRYDGGGYIINAGSDLASAADDLDVQTANVNQIFNYDPLNTTSAIRPAVAQTFLNANTSEQWTSAQQMQNIVNAVRTTSPAFLSGSGISGFPAGWMAPSYDKATQFFDTSHFNHDLVQQSLGRDGKTYAQPPTYDVAEHIRSAYLRADFEQPLFGYTVEGNFGVRYTGTRTSGLGIQQYRFRVPRSNGSSFDDRISTNQIVEVERKYHDWLPSFNAATWIVPDQLVVRLGYGKVMSRPSIDRLAPNLNCLEGSRDTRFGGNGEVDTCTAGNPDLKPYRATNKDLSLEWYPNRDSQMSAAFFRKDIQTSIMTDVVVRKDVFGNGKLWDVTTSINYQGATTDGIELAGRTAFTFLPGVFSGFGADVNYTRMKFKYAPGATLINALDGSVLPFPGMSKNSYNIGLWYDKDRINARLAYNFRDPYYTGGTDVNTGNPVFSEKTGYLDGKIQFRWNDHLTVSVEGKNLTDERTLTTAGSTLRPNELAWSGRRYFASLSYKY